MMAMSKKCFVFVLCLIVGIIIAGVVFVAIRLNQHGVSDREDSTNEFGVDSELLKAQSDSHLDPDKAIMMCESIINGTEPRFGVYNHRAMYQSTLGVNQIAVRVVEDYNTLDTYQKNSYWLTGDQFADRQAISMIRAEACQDKVPVIVVKMRPREGLSLSRNIQTWNHYQPKQILETWDDYDKRLNQYLNFLAPIPAIVILEPDLLMFTYDNNNLQYGWLNDKYKEEFFIRAQRVIKLLTRSWIYVDAGNAAYLRVRENMEKMAKSLLRLDGLRGFSINTAHFFNTSYNNMMARRLHCLTGLHYITDTSRNGGPFSRQSTGGIEKCFFDPPRILQGLPPGWSWGIKLLPRQKRWAPELPPSPTHQQTHAPTSPQTRPRVSGPPPDPQQDPEGYNNYINSMRNGNNNNNNINNNYNSVNHPNGVYNFGAHQASSVAQPQPNNIQPHNNQHNNRNRNGGGNTPSDFDLNMPNGRVPITAITVPPPTKATRLVMLRSKEEALSIYRAKAMRRGKCIQMEPVTVHDANVWIKAPGEADGRMYPWGTYHKCLLGHTQPCETECRLIMNTEYEERAEKCGCNKQPSTSESSENSVPDSDQPGIFFPGSDFDLTDSNSNSDESPKLNNPNIYSSYTSLSDILAQGGKKR